MDAIYRETLFNRLQSWILEAGVMIREGMHRPLTIDTKSNPNDLVTEMDREVEFFFAEKIKQYYPEHSLLGEEGYGDQIITEDGVIWIIDPIDGTTNFVHQRKNFAISVGIYADGIGEIGMIYDVINGHLYSGIRNGGAYKNNQKLARLAQTKKLHQSIICLNHHWLTPNRFVDEKVMHQLIKDVRGARTYGTAALEFVDVAEGAIDAYLTMRLAPWDFAAGRIILQEVGGILSDIHGQPVNFLEKSSVIACNPAIHEQLILNYLQIGKK